MKRMKISVLIVAAMVFFICVYIYLLGNGFFNGKFVNDGFSWYFLAKGLFCATALYLLVSILEQLHNKK